MHLGRSPVSRLLGVGITLTVAAGALAVVTDHDGAGPVVTFVERPRLTLVSVDVAPNEVSLAWEGNSEEYRISLGDDLSAPATTIVTTEPQAVLAAPEAADPRGRVNYRVEAVDDGHASVTVEGTLTLLPAVPARPKATQVEPRSAVVRWQPADYATTYDVAVAADKSTIPPTAQRLTDGGTSYSTTTLAPDSTYWVRVRAVGDAGVSDFGPPVRVRTPPASSDVTVGAWNICSESCSGYAERAPQQAARVQASTIDVIALQEAGGVKVGATTRAVFSGGAKGFVAATGGTKSRYLFYRAERFDQLDGGAWLVGYYGATWARLRDKQTERTFYVLSIHLDNGKSAKANAIRASQIRTVLARLAATNTTGDPVVVAGDFNSGRHRSGDDVGPLMRDAGFIDTVEIAAASENADVNTGSRRGTSAIRSHAHVDHVYASSGLEVPSWKQWVDLSGSTYVGPWLSDHNLISATVRLPRETPRRPAPSEVLEVPSDVTAEPAASQRVD